MSNVGHKVSNVGHKAKITVSGHTDVSIVSVTSMSKLSDISEKLKHG